MAKDYEINLKVDTGSSVSDLNNLESALSGISDELVPLTSQMGEMEDQLMLMAYAGDTSSEEFKKLSLEVAGMRQVIRETDAGLEALSMTTTQKVGGAISGATSGFEAFQGAMGAFGVESEAVEAALLKVQSAMALTQGIQGIKEALPSFTALKTGAVDTFQKMTTAGKAFALTGIGLIITAIGSAIAYYDDLKESLSNTSISQKALTDTQEDYAKGAQDSIAVTTEMKTKFDLAKQGVISKEEALDAYNETLGDSFGKATNLNDAEKLFSDKTDAYILASAKRMQAQALLAKAAEESAKAMTMTVEDAEADWTAYGKTALALYTQGYEGALGVAKKEKERLLAEQKKAKEEGAKTIENLARDLLKESASIEKEFSILSDSQIAQQKKADDAAQEAEEKRKERAEKQKQWLADQKAALDELNKANLDYLNSKKTEEEQEVISAQAKWKALIDNAKKYKLDTKKLVENQNDELAAINKKYRDAEIQAEKDKLDAINKLIQQQLQDREDFDALYYEATTSAQQQELDAVGEKYFYLIEMAKQYGYDTKKLEDDRIAKEKEINDKYIQEKLDADALAKQTEADRITKLNEYRVQAVTNTLTTIGNLTTLFAGKSEAAQRKAFNIQKAVNIAQAIMDTYKAANVALASAPAPYNFIAMAAAITTGLVNVKTIMAQKFEGSGSAGGGTGTVSSGGGGGTAGTSTTMTPQFNVVGNSGLNQLAQVAGQPIQAYVVSGQITTAQSLDRNKIENATL